MFWSFSIVLFLLALLFVLLPLWRGRTKENRDNELRKEANVNLFHEREADLQADLESGNLDQQQFNQLIAELQHTLLADVASIAEEKPLANQKKQNRLTKKSATVETVQLSSANFIVPAVLALLIPLLAYSLYDRWGFLDEVEMMDLYQRTVDNRDDPEEAQELIVSLGQSVQDNEDQPWTWYFLAENFANLGMFNEAEIAYVNSSELLEATPEKALVLGRVAMAMYINAGLEFTPAILEVVEQARAINPNEISILQLLASDAAENENYEAAIQYWRLLIQANPNSEQAQQLRMSIAAAQQILAQQNPDLVAGPAIDVSISLAPGLELDENLRVFVAARNADRQGIPPLAATSLVVGNLPISIQLDDSSAVGPFNLSSAENVLVSALVSYAGVATPQAGDYRVVSESISLDDGRIEVDLVIVDQVE